MLFVNSDIDIQGNGQTIDAAGYSGIFYADSASLGLSSLTLTGGSAASGGGGILALSSPVTLSHTTVSGNTASYGGGICVSKTTLVLDHSTVSGNYATSNGPETGNGGGLAIKYDSNVTLTDSTVSGNTADMVGGGIFQAPGFNVRNPGPNDGGTQTLVTSSVSNNQAGYNAGGIYTEAATASITDSSITNNQVKTGYGNATGGITFDASQATLDNSTISGNSVTPATQGSPRYLAGGLYVRNSPVSLTNCTVANNAASGYYAIAGGLAETHDSTSVGSGLVLTNTTVSGNSAVASSDVGVGGVLVGFGSGYGSASLQNTIVSGNSGSTDADIAMYSATTGGSAGASPPVAPPSP